MPAACCAERKKKRADELRASTCLSPEVKFTLPMARCEKRDVERRRKLSVLISVLHTGAVFEFQSELFEFSPPLVSCPCKELGCGSRNAPRGSEGILKSSLLTENPPGCSLPELRGGTNLPAQPQAR